MDYPDIVRSTYKRILNRGVDPSGLETYTTCLKNGQTINWLEKILISSEEYEIQQYANPYFSEYATNKINTKIEKEQQEAIAKEKTENEAIAKEKTEKEAIAKKKAENEAIAKEKAEKEAIVNILDIYKKNINIFMCVRNNESTLQNTFDCLKFIEQAYPNFSFYYFIFENDSTDKTPHILLDFFKYKKGAYRIEKLNNPMWGQDKHISRVTMMAEYRNIMKGLCKNWSDSSFSLIIDTNVEFKTDTFKRMLDVLKDDSIAMVTPYGLVKQFLPKKQYYDTYALSLKSGTQSKFIQNPSNLPGIVEVNSAFCGFVCIRTEVLEKCIWKEKNKDCSEHNHFCDMVKKYGKVVVATDIFVDWFA